MRSIRNTITVAVILGGIAGLAALAPLAARQTVSVTIVDRRTSETPYDYVVPNPPDPSTGVNTNCGDGRANCSPSLPSGTAPPSAASPYHVRGTTLALRLPGGRILVVNCEGVPEPKSEGLKRCQAPRVNQVEGEVTGETLKLRWAVMTNGVADIESESYQILGRTPTGASSQ